MGPYVSEEWRSHELRLTGNSAGEVKLVFGCRRQLVLLKLYRHEPNQPVTLKAHLLTAEELPREQQQVLWQRRRAQLAQYLQEWSQWPFQKDAVLKAVQPLWSLLAHRLGELELGRTELYI